MDLISDILLIAGALGAAFYCFILSRRLNRFTNLDKGVGGAIAVLSAQVDDLTRTLGQAQGSAGASTVALEALTERAESVSRRLEMLVASMHDLPMTDDGTSGPVDQGPRDVAEAPFRANSRQAEKKPPEMFRSSRHWHREAAE